MISVIIPVLDRPRHVQNAVASVLAQTSLDPGELEIVVVDDASAAPLTLPPAENVNVVRLARNRGPAGARNAGVAASRGQFIALLDSDDAWLADKVSDQLEFFHTACGSDALTAVVSAFYYRNRWGKLEHRVPHEAGCVSDFVRGCWFSPGSTLFAPRSLFERVGMFDERLRRLEDLDWFVRLSLLGGRLAVCPRPHALILPSRRADRESIVAACQVMECKFESVLNRRDQRNLGAYLELERCAGALSDFDRVGAFAHLVRSFACSPRWRASLARWSSHRQIPMEVARHYGQLNPGSCAAA